MPKREPMIKPVLYVFVNRGLGMSSGKIAAQVAQATAGALNMSDPEAVKDWWGEGAGQHHPTYVMLGRDAGHLRDIQSYLEARDFKTFLMIDEGLTEIDPHTATALGVEIVDKADGNVSNTFQSFELYRDTVKVTMEFER